MSYITCVALMMT